MSSIATANEVNGVPPPVRALWPDHTQLPDSDGLPVDNFFEHPQSILLSESLWPLLQKRHPDGRFAVGQSSGIYFEYTDPPLEGCRAPDWFYVPDVPPLADGQYRHSYVMWKEIESPLLLMEFVSGSGKEERDRTAHTGKFWIDEQAVRASYYVIFEPDRESIEGYHLVNGRYQLLKANERGRIVIEPLGIELGLWHSTYLGHHHALAAGI